MHSVLIASEPASAEEFDVDDDNESETALGWTNWDEPAKDKMLRQFRAERLEIQAIKERNARLFRTPIDAFGIVRDQNEDLNLKGSSGMLAGDIPEREIKLLWRDVYYRKTIPEIIAEDDGGARAMFQRAPHWGSGAF
jgi:hypothetical protein